MVILSVFLACNNHTVPETLEQDWESERLVFALVGDAGTGNADQRNVGARLATVCAEEECAFVLYLGDNFYRTGASEGDKMEQAFETMFTVPYADLNVPFYAVSGNHDFGGSGAGWHALFNPAKLDVQMEVFPELDDKWVFPSRYYSLRYGGLATFIGLDSMSLALGGDRRQADWALESLAASETEWNFVFGHHTIRSGGKHGDAGQWSGNEPASGATWADLYQAAVAGGKLDGAFTGHDHNMHVLMEQGVDLPAKGEDTVVIVSGASGKLSELGEGTAAHALYTPASDEEMCLGFVLVELTSARTGSEMNATVYRVAPTEVEGNVGQDCDAVDTLPLPVFQ